MTLCFDNKVTDCTKVKKAANTTYLFFRITGNCYQCSRCCLTYWHNLWTVYIMFIILLISTFWDDLSCSIYSSVITNSDTSESFIRLFPELFSVAILFCFLTNLMSRFFPWQMEVSGFLFIVSLLQVRKLSPVLCHALNWLEERHPFCSSRTLIVLHSLEAI